MAVGVTPCILVAGSLVLAWWILVALALPVLYSVMVIARTFAIFPDGWTWLEKKCDHVT